MKLLNVSHRSIKYEFRYLELSKLIQITKGGVFSYEIRLKHRLFYCSCPGYKYHGKCWHRSKINELLAQPTIYEPWALWAEEAEIWQGVSM